jgi:metallo-beta-lactamase class B
MLSAIMPRRKMLFAVLLAGLCAAQTAKLWTVEELFRRTTGGRDAMNRPFPPHKIIGNIYFVGTENLGSFLITTPEGHILINSDFEATVPLIRDSVEKLGFRFNDVKILLGSHAHGDHMQGDALVKELTGARVMAMEQDVPALRGMTPGGKPHPIDRILHDGDEVKLGGTTLVAHLTAGHTRGCTTWTMKAVEGGKSYDVVIVGSIGINPGFKLVKNTDAPQIVEEFERSYKTLRALHCDVPLGSHTPMYNLDEKYPRVGKGPNPFIDPEGYKSELDLREQVFRAELERQKKEAGQ